MPERLPLPPHSHYGTCVSLLAQIIKYMHTQSNNTYKFLKAKRNL